MTNSKTRKTVLTSESIIAALGNGAMNMTQIAHSHGYIGNVSGDVTKVIRKLVPKIGEMLADAKAGKVVAVVQKPVQKPVVQVPQKKGVYSGMYGAVYTRAVAAGTVPVCDFIRKTATEVLSDPACLKAVGKIKKKNPDLDLLAQVTKAITFAIGVIRTPKHTSNMNRSKSMPTVRGNIHIVPFEA